MDALIQIGPAIVSAGAIWGYLSLEIACYADHHAKVTKIASHGRTVNAVEVLDGEARVTEPSQMLGSDSGATSTNALEMLRQATGWKESKRVHRLVDDD